MGKRLDITGQRYGRLVAEYPTEKRVNGCIVWHCKCDCGNEYEVSIKNLRMGRTKSCGCLKKESDKAPNVKNTIDMIGKKFGSLTVIERAGSDHRGEALWLCQCDCGSKPIKVLGSNLRTGHTSSCGCERRSRGERKIAEILIQNKIPFIMEYRFKDFNKYSFDFYILGEEPYCVEYDGETHFSFNLHGWHTEEQYLAQLERDKNKNEYCKKKGIPLIRIPYTHFEKIQMNDLLPGSNFLIK